MIENIEEITEKIRKYTKASVSESRYEHSIRTAETCAELCSKYGLDVKTGYLAGIAHDMCKKMEPEKLFSTASKDGEEISELERKNPSLLHGRAAAVLIQEKFGIKDKNVIEAIANHTFGRKGTCDLAKIVFIADKIEPARSQVTEEYKKSIKDLSLNQLLYKVVSESAEYISKKGKKVAPQTKELLEYMKSGGL